MLRRYLQTPIWKNFLRTVSTTYFYSGKLTRKDLHDLLKLATKESFSIFDNKL